MRILLVEDEREAALLLERILQHEGFVVDVVPDGEAVAPRLERSEYDIILLDWLLPGISGLDLCCELRAHGVETPLVMISARAAVADRVAGLDAGADDYLVKPFAVPELLARIRALLRRGSGKRAPLLQVLDLVFDPASRVVRRGARRVDLTAKEEAILEYLLRRAGEVVTRASLSDHVWPEESDNLTNLIDVHMSKLRRKVDGPGEEPLIHTVRGRGYRVGPEPDLARLRATGNRPL
jgi:DNA-binding response OmpR family regulator